MRVIDGIRAGLEISVDDYIRLEDIDTIFKDRKFFRKGRMISGVLDGVRLTRCAYFAGVPVIGECQVDGFSLSSVYFGIEEIQKLSSTGGLIGFSEIAAQVLSRISAFALEDRAFQDRNKGICLKEGREYGVCLDDVYGILNVFVSGALRLDAVVRTGTFSTCDEDTKEDDEEKVNSEDEIQPSANETDL